MVNLYDSVGKKIGWDFSNISPIVKNKKWSYYDVVRGLAKKSDMVLDIGTGGGEVLLKIVPLIKYGIGIDNSREMLSTALINKLKLKKANAAFLAADSSSLPFCGNYFDMVLSRHSPINTKEVYRILKRGGLLITQQVGEEDKKNIKALFGRGQAYGRKSGFLISNYMSELTKCGFSIIRQDRYNATEYYSLEDLTFLLKHTPIIPNFSKKDLVLLKEYSKDKLKGKDIETNSERYLIVAKKL